MKRYEGLFILNTAAKEEGIKDIIDAISAEITAAGGKVETVQKMDKRAFTRVADKPYKWKITEAPLEKVANVEKMLPRDFITRDGYGITAKARAYLAPLIAGEDPPPFKDGLPRYERLKNLPVAKKLAAGFDI